MFAPSLVCVCTTPGFLRRAPGWRPCPFLTADTLRATVFPVGLRKIPVAYGLSTLGFDLRHALVLHPDFVVCTTVTFRLSCQIFGISKRACPVIVAVNSTHQWLLVIGIALALLWF